MCLNMCIMKRTNYYFPEQMFGPVIRSAHLVGLLNAFKPRKRAAG